MKSAEELLVQEIQDMEYRLARETSDMVSRAYSFRIRVLRERLKAVQQDNKNQIIRIEEKRNGEVEES